MERNITKNKYYNTDSNNNLTPLLTYINAFISKKNILNENKNKSGIYRWVNTINNKSYIGSGINLTKRLGSYYRNSELTRNPRLINLALIKYGHTNFRLDILEYCSKDKLLEREQYYIDLINPEYNILKIAGSLLGYKHSNETIEKLKNRVITEEHKEILSSYHSNKYVSQETRDKLSIATTKYKKNNPLSVETLTNLKYKSIEREGVAVLVLNIETNEELEFSNQTAAGSYIGVQRQAIYRAIKK